MDDSQQRLRLAMEAARMAIWDSHIVNGHIIEGSVDWTAPGTALLGLPPQPLRHSYRDFLGYVHAEDRERVVATMQDGVERRGDYALEYRVVWPDGEVHWLAARAQVFCDADDRPERTLGIIWDVTERRLDEIHIAESRELAEVTLSSIGDAVITTDAEGRTQYLNRVAEQLTGWNNETARGVDVRDTLRLVDENTGEALENVALRCLRLRQSIGISSHSQLITRSGHAIAVEDSAAPIHSRNGDILGAVVVFHDVSHERKLAQQLSWQASHDTLTGLINRREFERQVAAALHSAKEEGHVHALLFMDLDQFKIINDTCGHGAGDLLLQLLSKTLQQQMRDSDILARLGGDELGVLLPHCPPERARKLAEDIRAAVKHFRFVWDERSFELGISIGLVEISHDSKSMTELLMAADQACYVAKEQGRNRVHEYRESDQALARRKGEMLWITRLNEAFEHQHFRLYAMPIVHLQAPAETHEEVLIRIVNAQGELILPGAFIPAAERYDLMHAIDRWVIQAVCAHIADSGETARYSINLSGVSLSDTTLHDYIIEQFSRHGVAPELICFEITETAVIANLPKAQEFMAELKGMGCRFSLDDFGSGLSSFAYLKALPVDYLKIDGAFVRDIAGNAINRAMVKAINEVGHVMGIQTVAEYVEDDEVLSVVRALGVDYAQGYAVGQLRPLGMAAH
jgi:diguanylate cyclase (GGDEF)-like protein/PAS domain S-box-containing protein